MKASDCCELCETLYSQSQEGMLWAWSYLGLMLEITAILTQDRKVIFNLEETAVYWLASLNCMEPWTIPDITLSIHQD